MATATSNERSAETSAYLALAAACLFWAGNVVVGRAMRDEIDPATLNIVRWTLALLIFLAIAWPRISAGWPQVRRDWRLVAAQGVTGVALFQMLMYAGAAATPAVNVVLIIAATPAIILIWTSLLRRAAPSGAQALGVAVSLAGVAAIIVEGDPGQLTALRFTLGDLWTALAAVLWAAYTLLLRAAPADLDPWSALAGAMVAGWLATAPFAAAAFWMGGAAPDLTDPALLSAVVYVAVFPSIAAFICWGWGVARIGPVRAGLFMNLIPLFGAGLAALFLGEGLAPHHLFGGALIFAGVALVKGARARPLD